MPQLRDCPSPAVPCRPGLTGDTAGLREPASPAPGAASLAGWPCSSSSGSFMVVRWDCGALDTGALHTLRRSAASCCLRLRVDSLAAPLVGLLPCWLAGSSSCTESAQATNNSVSTCKKPWQACSRSLLCTRPIQSALGSSCRAHNSFALSCIVGIRGQSALLTCIPNSFK